MSLLPPLYPTFITSNLMCGNIGTGNNNNGDSNMTEIGFVKVSLVVGEYIVPNIPEAIAEARADLETDLDTLVREWNINDHIVEEKHLDE